MRFIIHEQPYEKPVAAGKFRFEQQGKKTGAVETWRLTAAAEGYRFLRVDLDARDAPSGHTYLYHAVLNADDQIERLKYRFWDREAQLQVSGDLVVEETAVSASRTVNGQIFAQALEMPAGFGVWFPSVTGLGFAARLQRPYPQPTVTLNNQIGGSETLAAHKVDISVALSPTAPEEQLTAGQKMITARRQISWEKNWRLVTLDEKMWPIGLERESPVGDGLLTAVAYQYIWYQ